MNERVALTTPRVSNSAAFIVTYECRSNSLVSIIFDYALWWERETTSDFHDNYAMKQKRKGGKQPSAITVITFMWGSGSAWQQFGGLVFQDLCLKKPRTAVIRNAWQWRRFLDEWWICGNDFGDWPVKRLYNFKIMIYGMSQQMTSSRSRPNGGPPFGHPEWVVGDSLEQSATPSLKNGQGHGYEVDNNATRAISINTFKNHKQRFCRKHVTHFVSIS